MRLFATAGDTAIRPDITIGIEGLSGEPCADLKLALRVLRQFHGILTNEKGNRYESERPHSPAFPSLTKREFHASNPKEIAHDDPPAVQS